MSEHKDMAQQLIDSVTEANNAELLVLRDRISQAFGYMDAVEGCNIYTLEHIRWILEGKHQ